MKTLQQQREREVTDKILDLVGLPRSTDLREDQDLFMLGFHSLNIAELAHYLTQTHGVEVRLIYLFSNPTVGGILDLVRDRKE